MGRKAFLTGKTLMEQRASMTLQQLQQRINSLITCDATRDVWVTAELSDVAVRGGHCYMELLQKDAAGAVTVAKARGIIWASAYRSIAMKFHAATGRPFATGLKVMVRVTATYHPVYGFSLLVSDVDPAYTMGDLLRRRAEIIARLRAEGILEQNRSLDWPAVARRIAVISAPGAAGYGDFVNQLLRNPRHLRFAVKLFPAVMQGDRTPSTVIAALEAIVADSEEWDCVVIIRGGGATSDLAAFEDYGLAAAVAMFPLPVIVGIGHERDTTVLDDVANMRVKTPTAAAEWLIARGAAALDSLRNLGNAIALAASERVAGSMQRLAYFEGLLPVIPLQSVERQRARLLKVTSQLTAVAGRIGPHITRLDAIAEALRTAAASAIERRSARLDALTQLVSALSPAATLARGYSITRIDGHALKSAAALSPGQTVTTILADGSFKSTVS